MKDEDALTRALLMAAFGMMGAPTLAQGVSRGGMFGLQAYDAAQALRDRRMEEAQQREMRGMQIEQAKRAVADQEAHRALATRAFAPGAQNLVANDDEGFPLPTGGGGGLPEYVRGLWQISPEKALAVQQSMARESPWAKLNPKDYTPASLMRFMRSNNPADLEPAAEAVKTGTVRERMSGQNVVQEEFDGKQWNPIGQGPRFKPEGPEKPPAGYRYAADGKTLEAIPGGPATKPPVEALKQQTGVKATVQALKDYRGALKQFNPSDYLSPDKRASLSTLHNNALLQMKEAYNLGVLNGPDYMLMLKSLTDPLSMKGLAMSRGGLNDQIDTISGAITKIGEASAQVHGQGQGAPKGGAPVVDFADLKKKRSG